MIALDPPLRPATPADGRAMAELINIAAEGLPLYLWEGMAEPGESGWTVGERRARRDEGGFSYRNTVLMEEDGRVAAGLIGYPLPDLPVPIDRGSTPAMFAAVQELETSATGTWYINVLATYPQWRGRGFGTALLEVAVRQASDLGLRGLSLILSDANTDAGRLYARCGYREVASRPMIKDGWRNPGRNWLLLIKDL